MSTAIPRVDEAIEELDLFLIPCNGKIAILKGWPKMTEKPSILEGNNYGIACGDKNGIYVVDCDKKKPGDGEDLMDGCELMDILLDQFNDGEEWDTPQVITGSGGRHYYFKFDKQCQKTNAIKVERVDNMGLNMEMRAKVDTRGNGGYVLGPGSVHPTTRKSYEWKEDFSIEDREPMKLPEKLAKLIDGSHYLYIEGNSVRLKETNVIPAAKKLPTPSEEAVPAVSSELLGKIVMGLDKKRACDRTDWRDVIWAIQNSAGNAGLDLAIDFSKQAKEKYEGAEDVLSTMQDTNGSINTGSLWHWLKKDNPALFEELQQEQRISKQEETKADFKKDYYLMDFTTLLASKTWSSADELYSKFKEHVGKVLFRTYGGFEWYIKLNREERFMPLRRLPKDPIAYLDETNDKPVVKTVTFARLAEIMMNYVPKYDRTVFVPSSPAEECIDQGRDMNIWPGFKAQLVEQLDMTKVQPILDHIRVVWASEDQTHYEYLMAWIKAIIMKPREKTRVAVVLRSGKQQIGKGLIADDFIRKLVIGEDIGYYDKGLDFLTQRFNENLMSKIFVIADELTSIEGNGYHATFDALKSMITCSTMGIEIKGGRKFNAESYINLMLLTNNQFSIKVEEGDRRYFILDCNECYADNTAYFDNMIKNYINQDCANHFLTYMSQYKTDVNLRDIPVTKLKEEMIEQNLNSGERFINKIREVKASYIEELGGIEEEMAKFDTVPAKHVYEVYGRWCHSVGEKALSQRTFSMAVKAKVEVKRKATGMVYVF